MTGWQVGYDIVPETAFRVRDVVGRMRPHRLSGAEKIRVGRFHDGGYVMIDRFEGVEAAYSLGINDDVSWDIDIARLNIPIYQYDHTIPGLPEHHPMFNWEPLEISGAPSGEGTASLAGLIEKNGHKDARNMLLKCDIEGSEWLLLQQTPNAVLRQFSQIVIEIHTMEHLLRPSDGDNVRRAIMNLTASHHVVHVHANNFAPLLVMGGIPVPNVLELTLMRKDAGSFTPSDEVFPTALDMPCHASAADLFLGRFAFD